MWCLDPGWAKPALTNTIMLHGRFISYGSDTTPPTYQVPDIKNGLVLFKELNRPQQNSAPRLQRRMTFAGHRLQALQIGYFDIAPDVANHPGILKN
jgi:hypothetical protein